MHTILEVSFGLFSLFFPLLENSLVIQLLNAFTLILRKKVGNLRVQKPFVVVIFGFYERPALSIALDPTQQLLDIVSSDCGHHLTLLQLFLS